MLVDADLDLTALEAELCRIPEVTAARVVANTEGDIEEVHILSMPSKHAKQVVRDVQSVAMATFNIDLDRRVVSVVQLEGGQYAEPAVSGVYAEDETTGRASTNGQSEPGHRITVESVRADRSGVQCTAEVTLSRGSEEAVGKADGLVASSSVLRLVAQATVVIVVPPYEEVSSGSAVVRSAGDLDAVARAILDATNRRLPQLR